MSPQVFFATRYCGAVWQCEGAALSHAPIASSFRRTHHSSPPRRPPSACPSAARHTTRSTPHGHAPRFATHSEYRPARRTARSVRHPTVLSCMWLNPFLVWPQPRLITHISLFDNAFGWFLMHGHHQCYTSYLASARWGCPGRHTGPANTCRDMALWCGRSFSFHVTEHIRMFIISSWSRRTCCHARIEISLAKFMLQASRGTRL